MDSQMVTATWQGAALSGISNILGQIIGCYQDNVSVADLTTGRYQLTLLQVPITINWTDLTIFTIFTILNSPPNFFWQMWLEDHFPGYDRTSQAVKDKDTAQPTLNKRNTAIKFALDQTVGAAFNTFVFLIGIPLLRGQPWGEAMSHCREGFWPLIFAGQKMWPFVSIALFTFVPAELRMVVGGIFGLFWNIYLTLVSGRSKGAKE